MPTFDIAWTRRASHQWKKSADDDWAIEAVLAERVIVGDKTAIKVVCRIAASARTASTTSANAIGSGTADARGKGRHFARGDQLTRAHFPARQRRAFLQARKVHRCPAGRRHR